MKISSAAPCGLGSLSTVPACGAALFWIGFALASSAFEAIGAEPWLPHFAPTTDQENARDGTEITLKSGETKVYKFDTCEPVTGRINIVETRDRTPKVFAVSAVAGQTVAQDPACGTDSSGAVTRDITFASVTETGCAVNDNPSTWFFSIECKGGGSCAFFWRVNNDTPGGRIDCGEEPEPECPECPPGVALPTPTIELRLQNEAGQTALNTANGLPCKYVGSITMIDDTRDPPRAWMTIEGDPQICEWPE